MNSENLPSNKKIFCNNCKTFTNHFSKALHHKEHSEESGWWDEIDYIFWICAGCDSAVLEQRYTDAAISPEYISDYYPSQNRDLLQEKYFTKLPTKLIGIYREIIHAFNNDLYILAASGLRSLIEGICSEKQITGKNLEEKINRMDTLLPQNIVSNLHSFRFIGNVAVHELEFPERQNLKLAIEISEDLLNFLYELDYKASRLPKAKTG